MNVNDWFIPVVSAISPIFLAVVWRLITTINELSEVRGKVETLQGTALSLLTSKADHDVRLALAEKAVSSLSDIHVAIKDLVIISSRLEAMHEQANRRLEMLEDTKGNK